MRHEAALAELFTSALGLCRQAGLVSVGVESDGDAAVEVELDPERFVTRPEGRRAWLREGRRALDQQREREARPVARERSERLFQSAPPAGGGTRHRARGQRGL